MDTSSGRATAAGQRRLIVRLNLAAYLSAERGCVVDLTDQKTLDELETYVPLIQQGRGNEVLMK